MDRVRVVIENEDQQIREEYEGQASEKDGVLYVFYEREQVKHRLDISKERVVMKKTTTHTEEMVIEMDHKHPYVVTSNEGNILLDTIGKKLEEKSIPSGKKYALSYQLFQGENLLGDYLVSIKILYF